MLTFMYIYFVFKYYNSNPTINYRIMTTLNGSSILDTLFQRLRDNCGRGDRKIIRARVGI